MIFFRTKTEDKWGGLLIVREGSSGDFIPVGLPTAPGLKYTFAIVGTDYDHYLAGIVVPVPESCDWSRYFI